MVHNRLGSEGAYAETWHRSGNAFNQQNIQMLNVINFWWFASVTGDIKMIEYGDKFFYGAQQRLSAIGQQKAKNQNMESIYEAFYYRNLVTGRND